MISLLLNISTYDVNMVFTRKKKKQNKSLCQLNELLNGFIFGNDTHADTVENEIVEPQTGGLIYNFGKSAVGGSSTSHNQSIEKDIAE